MKSPSDSDVTRSVRAELELKLARHADAHARQDLETALDLYTEDAIVRPANMDAVHGHAGLRQFFSNWWTAMEVQSAEYTTLELDVHGESAYHIGTYTGVQTASGRECGSP